MTYFHDVSGCAGTGWGDERKVAGRQNQTVTTIIGRINRKTEKKRHNLQNRPAGRAAAAMILPSAVKSSLISRELGCCGMACPSVVPKSRSYCRGKWSWSNCPRHERNIKDFVAMLQIRSSEDAGAPIPDACRTVATSRQQVHRRH